MVKFWDGYLLVNSYYYVQIKFKKKFIYKKVSGKKIKIDEDLDLFLHRITKRGKKFWTVSEATSGSRLAKLHKKPQQAISKAKQIIEEKGVSAIKARAIRNVKKSSLSPRYRFIVNPTRQKRCGNLNR